MGYLTPKEIKEARNKLGMTQSQLAYALRLEPISGRNTIRAWETGKREITGPASLALEALVREQDRK